MSSDGRSEQAGRAISQRVGSFVENVAERVRRERGNLSAFQRREQVLDQTWLNSFTNQWEKDLESRVRGKAITGEEETRRQKVGNLFGGVVFGTAGGYVKWVVGGGPLGAAVAGGLQSAFRGVGELRSKSGGLANVLVETREKKGILRTLAIGEKLTGAWAAKKMSERILRPSQETSQASFELITDQLLGTYYSSNETAPDKETMKQRLSTASRGQFDELKQENNEQNLEIISKPASICATVKVYDYFNCPAVEAN